MKYALLIGDGMADFAVPALGERTPLEYAKTPNMDRVARDGQVGLVQTVPDGMAPGSDVANLALMGYDPRRYYRGRAPVEAASMGVALRPEDVALRCNLVSLDGDSMADYSAGHIETSDAREIIAVLQRELGSDDVAFHPGVSYRHLVVMQGIDDAGITTVPPHDITGKPWEPHLPTGHGSERLRDLMARSREVLADCETNRRRRDQGKPAVSSIWLWGQGRPIELPSLRQRFGLTGSVVSAVDLVRGLGLLAGLTVRMVDGATGYLGTNYAGKVAAALEALEQEDLVYLHVEAPDETGHEGDVGKKVQAIEEFDSLVVGPMLGAAAKIPDLRILVAPDHATPVSLKTHHAMPVPYALCGAGVSADESHAYSESAAAGREPCDGPMLFERLIHGS